MKKIISIIFISLFCLYLTGCNTNNPSSKVENYLSKYTSLDENVTKDIDNVVASSNLNDELSSIYKEVLERQYKDMKYEILDEYINGEDAIVTARITVYDYYKSEKDSLEYLTNNITEFYTNNELDNNLYEKYRLNNMNKTKETISYDINFYLVKENGTWIVQNPDNETLEKIHGIYKY